MSESTESHVDVRRLMAQIRSKVEQDLAEHKDALPEFHPAHSTSSSSVTAGDLVHSEDLRYLNTRIADGLHLDLNAIQSHRPGFIGKAIVKCKRKVLSVIWESLIRPLVEAELRYRHPLVRFLNDTTKYVDARDSAIFWELIRKLDVDIGRAMHRIETIHDEQMAELRSAEKRVFSVLGTDPGLVGRRLGNLEQRVDALTALDRVVSGLEATMAQGFVQGRPPLAQTGSEAKPSEASQGGTPYYLLLENRFRGSEQEIAQRLKVYPKFFDAADKRPVLDLGCGRGELLALLKDVGIPSVGIDTDAAMIESARARGFQALFGDGIEHLRQLEDRSLQGLIAIQVVEHLPFPLLRELFRLASQKVKVGGRVIFETINPRSLVALSSNYFRDPTHQFPLHPDTLAFEMSLAGLETEDTLYLSPVPVEAKLSPLPKDEYLTPRWADLVDRLNGTIGSINDLLFGYQDYAVVSKVRE